MVNSVQPLQSRQQTSYTGIDFACLVGVKVQKNSTINQRAPSSPVDKVLYTPEQLSGPVDQPVMRNGKIDKVATSIRQDAELYFGDQTKKDYFASAPEVAALIRQIKIVLEDEYHMSAVHKEALYENDYYIYSLWQKKNYYEGKMTALKNGEVKEIYKFPETEELDVPVECNDGNVHHQTKTLSTYFHHEGSIDNTIKTLDCLLEHYRR